MNNKTMNEHSVVKIVKLIKENRSCDGSAGVRRPPRVGDIGTVVHVLDPGYLYTVEMVDPDGHTLWLAEFVSDELELQ